MTEQNEQAVQFVIETVSGAFGLMDTIPWHRAHREAFPTLDAAKRARNRDDDEMDERCGATGWDSHRRIVPTQDTTITYSLHCRGWTNWIGQRYDTHCDAETTITLPWLAGEPVPYPEPPDGWYDISQCMACAEQAEAHQPSLDDLVE